MIVLPTLHPAALLRSSEGEAKSVGAFKDTVIGDFRRAIELRHRRPSWDEGVIWRKDGDRFLNMFPTLQEVWAWCWRNQGRFVAVDVETTGETALACNLMCVGLAADNGDAICVPFLSQHGVEYWREGEREKATEILRWFFAGASGGEHAPKLVFHNGSFDSCVLYAYAMPVFATWAEDTMQAHHCLDAELPHGLDYVASVCTEITYYKDAVKGDVRWLDLPDVTLRSYNLRDVLCTIRALPKLLEGLGRAGGRLWELYREEVALCHEMAWATIRGVFVDQWRKYRLSKKLRRQVDESIGVLRSIIGDPTFKPGSPPQLRWALFERLGFPVVKRTDKGHPSTDKDAMILLALHASNREQITFLTHLVKWRKSEKFLSTWVGEWAGDEWEGGEEFITGYDKRGEPIREILATQAQPQGQWIKGLPILWDGRVHPSWKMLTVTGRFASSPNAQNWNTAIKKIFCAPRGRKLVGSDLNQAELRLMAYYANDPALLLAYERGLNVHTINTTLLFQVRNPGKDTNDATEAFLAEACPRLLGVDYYSLPVPSESVWKPMRVLGKNFVFGDIYGAEAQTLYQVIRAKRDPDTDEPLFPNIQLSDIEAAKITWEKLHPQIPGWWKTITRQITGMGFYECPISGRRILFRAGFQRNKMLNNPIQTGVGSVMNKATLRIARRLPRSSGINLQVHDMLGAECDERDAADVREIFIEEQNKAFELPGFPRAILPPDAPSIGTYVDQV